MIPNIVFYITATITIMSAMMVILTKDIFRAALFLASTFLGVVGSVLVALLHVASCCYNINGNIRSIFLV